MTEEDFISKIIWEGGIVGALEYGLRDTDLADRNGPLATKWRSLQAKWDQLQRSLRAIEKLIPDEAW